MGAGIVEVCARADLNVVVVESNQDAVDAGRERLTASLRRAEAKGQLAHAAAVLDRVRSSTGLPDRAHRGLVIAAIVRNEAAKGEHAQDLDQLVTPSGAGL